MGLAQLSLFHISDVFNNAGATGWLLPLNGIQKRRAATAFLTNQSFTAFHVNAIRGGISVYLNDLFPHTTYLPFVLPDDAVCDALEFIPFPESKVNSLQQGSNSLFVTGVLREADDDTFVPSPLVSSGIVQDRAQTLEIPSINAQGTEEFTYTAAGIQKFTGIISGNTVPYGLCAFYLDAVTVSFRMAFGSNFLVDFSIDLLEYDAAELTLLRNWPLVSSSVSNGSAASTANTFAFAEYAYFPRNAKLLYFSPNASTRHFKLGLNVVRFFINGSNTQILSRVTWQGNFVGGPTFNADLIPLPGAGPSAVLF